MNQHRQLCLLCGALTVVMSAQLCAQQYDYRFPKEQRELFLGFNAQPEARPESVASRLMEESFFPQILNEKQFGMEIESVRTVSGNQIEVTTTGSTFFFDPGTATIACTQRIGLPPGGPSEREIVKMTIAGPRWTDLQLRSKHPGSVFLLAHIAGDQSLEFRITGDGILMTRYLSTRPSSIKVLYAFNFWPGYSGFGAPDSGLGKYDFSYLFLDNYGGFGVYLIDEYFDPARGKAAAYDGSGMYPQYSFVVSPGKVFWTAICPPKEYDWRRGLARPFIHYGAKETDNLRGNVRREQIVRNITAVAEPQAVEPYPNIGVFTGWRDKRLADGSVSDSPYADIIVLHSEAVLYDQWCLSYRPREFVFGSDTAEGWSLLDGVIDNAASTGKRVLFYTSPWEFYPGSRYYDGSGYFRGMKDSVNPMYIKGVPYISSMYDRYGSHYAPAWYSDPPGNPEGANIDNYLAAVDTLVSHRSHARPIDGIYIDGAYVNNIPQSYLLLRRVRDLLERRIGRDAVIYLHTTPRPGHEGYLPQINSYADFSLAGENGISRQADIAYFRYFQGTYNISNSVGILMRDYSWYTYPADIVSVALTVNLRLVAFPGYALNWPGADLVRQLESFWKQIADTDGVKRRFYNFAATENPKYRLSYEKARGR